MQYTLDLGSSAARCESSSLSACTKNKPNLLFISLLGFFNSLLSQHLVNQLWKQAGFWFSALHYSRYILLIRQFFDSYYLLFLSCEKLPFIIESFLYVRKLLMGFRFPCVLRYCSHLTNSYPNLLFNSSAYKEYSDITRALWPLKNLWFKPWVFLGFARAYCFTFLRGVE